MRHAVMNKRISLLATLLCACAVWAALAASSASALSFYPIGDWPTVVRLSEPRDVAIVGDEVFVVDSLGRRIVVLSKTGEFLRAFNGSEVFAGSLVRPVAIAAETTGTCLYVADEGANRISVFDRSGELLGTFGSAGTGDFGFNRPSDVCLSPDGTKLYVSDTFNDRIQVYTATGPASAFVRSMGNPDTISAPMGVAASAAEVFVADVNNSRIRVFNATTGAAGRDWGITEVNSVASSRYLGLRGIELQSSGHPLVIDAARGQIERCDLAGNPQTATPVGLFRQVEGLAEDADGTFLVADTGNNRVMRSTISSPAVLSTVSPAPQDLGGLTPSSVAVDADGTYYVADSATGAVRKYSDDGDLLLSFDASPSVSAPHGLAVSHQVDEVYVCDTGNRRVVAFDKQGQFLRFIGGPGTSSEYSTPTAVAVAADGSLHVADSGANVVQHVSSDGVLVESIGTGQLSAPAGVTMSDGGLVYVADMDNFRVAVFAGTTLITSEYLPFRPAGIAISNSGSLLALDTSMSRITWIKDGLTGNFGIRGAGPGQLNEPRGFSVRTDGTVIIADTGNRRIVRAGWDDLPPVTTAHGDILSPVSRPATVSLEATDTLSGVTFTYFRVGEGAVETYTSPIRVETEGETLIHYWSTDNADNVEPSKIATVVVDRIAPTGFTVFGDGQSVFPTGSVLVSSFVAGATQMRFGYADDISEQAWQNYSVSALMSLHTQGASTLVAQYRDAAGNAIERTFSCTVDGTGPVASAIRTSATNVTDGVNGVTLPRDGDGAVVPVSTGSATINLSAVDGLSSVASIRYRVNGGTERLYTNPFAVTSEGSYTVQVRAVDIVGNSGPTAKLVFGISKLPLGGVLQVGNGGYTNQQISRWTCTMRSAAWVRWNGSGEFTDWQPYVSNMEWWSTFPNTDGQHPFTVEFVDGVGTLLSASTTVTLDRVAPSAMVTRTPESWLSTGPAHVTATAEDALSPISLVRYRIDEGVFTTYTAPFPVSVDGSHTVQVWATDAAGNVSAPATATFGISRLPLGGRLVVANDAAEVESLTVEVTATVESATMMRWRLVGDDTEAEWVESFVPFARSWLVPLPQLGAHRIQAQFVDRFGQSVSLLASITALDRTGPVMSFARSAVGDVADGVGGVTLPRDSGGRPIPVSTGTATVNLQATDALSEVSEIRYRVDGGPQQVYSGPLILSRDGTHTIEASSTDILGNVGRVETMTLGISKLVQGGGMTLGDGSGYINARTVAWRASVASATAVRWDTSMGFTAWTPYMDGSGWEALFPDTEGPAAIHVQFRDAIGTVRQIDTPVVLDFSGPVASVGSIPALSPITGSYTVSLSATDSFSPVAAILYRVDGSEAATYTGAFPIAGDGAHLVEAWAIDVAGNQGEVHGRTLGISRLPFGATIRPADSSPEIEARGVDMLAEVLSASHVRARVIEGPGTEAWQEHWTDYTGSYVATVPGVGRHVVQAQFKDIFGQTVTATTTVNIVDHTGPVTAVVPTSAVPVAEGVNGVTLPRDGEGNPVPVHTGATTVVLKATDLLSDIASVHYRLDGSAEQTYTGTFEVSELGFHEVEAWSVDALGNVGALSVHTFAITPLPLAPEVVVGGGSFTPTQTVSWTASAQGATSIRWKTTGGFNGWQPFTQAVRSSVFPEAEGLNQLVVQFTDAIGTIVEINQLVIVDFTGPATEAVHQASPSTGPMWIELRAADNYPPPFAPAPTIKYRLDESEMTTYTGPFLVSEDGSHTIEAWSIDAAGNTGPKLIDRIGISGLPLGGSLVAANGAGVVVTPTVDVSSTIRSAVRMRWRFVTPSTADDPWAEEFQAFRPVWQATFPTDGQFTLQAQFEDLLGQLKTLSTQVAYDLRGPVTDIALEPDAAASAGPVTVSITATDALSAVRSVKYRVNGGQERTYLAPFVLTTEGTYTVQAWAFDSTGALGNRGDTTQTSLTITRMMSGGSVKIAGGAERIGVSDAAVAVSVSGATAMCWDAGAGFTAWVPYKSSFVAHFPVQGENRVLRVRFRDRFGVVREISDTITIDLDAPVTTAALPFGRVVHGPAVVVLSVSDLSPLKYTEYALDGTTLRRYTMPILVTAPGVHTVRFRSMDQFGALEKLRTETFEVRMDAAYGLMTLAGGRSFVNTTTIDASFTVPGATAMRLDINEMQGSGSPFAEHAQLTLPGGGLHWITGRFESAETSVTTLTVPVFVDFDAPVVSSLTPSVKSFRTYSSGNRYTVGVAPGAGDLGQHASGIGGWSWALGPYRSTAAGAISIYGPRAGTNALSLTVTDRAGNSASLTGRVRLGAARAPYVPRTATRNRYFTVKGTVPLAMSGATHRILCYRRSSNGTWYLSKTVTAKPKVSSTTATFSNRIYLGYGSWRIVLSSARASTLIAGSPSASIAVK